MQTLGTEWGRRCLGPGIWVSAAMAHYAPWIDRGVPIVFDDVRFPNEAAAIWARRGRIIRITRPGTEPIATADHGSEVAAGEIEADATIDNIGTPGDMARQIWAYVAVWEQP